ncbi:hypothetical protein CWATWH8502_539 [Crocosphaera watsonii WH 8502]|uniref:Uncharacterized protein n=1 Tax=Crocosphaera watsonii WH 8502 TaxID=423474 RepID=T2IH04_CROWT|nr:hypothetical protein CWATWH8502_539 [Crocosphaera watsonii WH 8502]
MKHLPPSTFIKYLDVVLESFNQSALLFLPIVLNKSLVIPFE